MLPEFYIVALAGKTFVPYGLRCCIKYFINGINGYHRDTDELTTVKITQKGVTTMNSKNSTSRSTSESSTMKGQTMSTVNVSEVKAPEVYQAVTPYKMLRCKYAQHMHYYSERREGYAYALAAGKITANRYDFLTEYFYNRYTRCGKLRIEHEYTFVKNLPF